MTGDPTKHAELRELSHKVHLSKLTHFWKRLDIWKLFPKEHLGKVAKPHSLLLGIKWSSRSTR